MGLDEATINTLPSNLLAEARRMQDVSRFERIRAREMLERLNDEGRGRPEDLFARHLLRGENWGDMIGRNPANQN